MQLKTNEIVAVAVIAAFAVGVAAFGLYPALRRAPRNQCLANLKGLSSVMAMYVSDNLGYLPPPERWIDAISPDYVNNWQVFVCPELRPTAEQAQALEGAPGRSLPAGYSWLEDLVGQNMARLVDPEKTPFLFDSGDVRPSSVAGLDDLAFRHFGRSANVSFADGHSESLTETPALPSPLIKTPQQMDAAQQEPEGGEHAGHSH